jgi:hypothetical protein
VKGHLARCPQDILILGISAREVLLWNIETETTAGMP